VFTSSKVGNLSIGNTKTVCNLCVGLASKIEGLDLEALIAREVVG
jgi:hypothetical protein